VRTRWSAASSRSGTQLGLALADEIREGWAMKVTFEHGFITWLPWIGTQVTFT
jgi:uncharacterized protein with LGFP repeats